MSAGPGGRAGPAPARRRRAAAATPEAAAAGLRLLGVDFSSAPSPRKPIAVAQGRLQGGTVVVLQSLRALPRMADFEALLAEPGPWLGAFDFPFGLPRDFVDALALGDDAAAVWHAVHARCGTRRGFQTLVDDWGRTRAPGRRLLHRATDRAGAVSSTSPLQTRYVPVGFMWFEGFGRLLQAGVDLPRLRGGDPSRVALEGYPARLAHALAGRRSYKNGDDAGRRQARRAILRALAEGRTPSGLALAAGRADTAAMVADAAGDRLDAALCLMQAAAASAAPGHGLPGGVDPVEGWIAGG